MEHGPGLIPWNEGMGCDVDPADTDWWTPRGGFLALCIAGQGFRVDPSLCRGNVDSGKGMATSERWIPP